MDLELTAEITWAMAPPQLSKNESSKSNTLFAMDLFYQPSQVLRHFLVAFVTAPAPFSLGSSRLHLCALNCSWMADCAFPMFGSPENSALQYSQIPRTGTFLTRFTIRRFRFGMSQVSHRTVSSATPMDLKLYHCPEKPRLDAGRISNGRRSHSLRFGRSGSMSGMAILRQQSHGFRFTENQPGNHVAML